MELNLVSRISDDKNFFVDMICAIHQVKVRHNRIVKLNFIGAVETEVIYRTLTRLIDLLQINKQVSFTRASIRYEDMTENMKDGYFVNFSVGNFIGYSSIECMKFDLKTFFYNVDESYKEIMNPDWKCFCPDYDSLINLINDISSNPELLNNVLYHENRKLLSEYTLSDSESDLLKSLIV